MRVLIRADASPTIGSGHIARCLTLARVLRAQGSHVAFACRRLPGHRLDALNAETGLALDCLSMGMSADYPIAIEEGATVVRVGRALFGERESGRLGR